MPVVRPEILVWARETAGLTLRDAAVKVGLKDARGVAARSRLAALERGEEKPTRSLLGRMARQYRRPLLVFYLDTPPLRDDRRPDFRTLPGPHTPKTDALIDALVRNLQSRQYMVRAALEAEDEAEPLPFVGSLPRSEGYEEGIEALSRVLRGPREATRWAQRASHVLGQVLGDDMNAAKYYEEGTPESAFELLRTRIEDAGVFVLLKGDLGSHHTTIDADVFRGFAIADDVAPFVVINDNDSRAARSFTLLHELTHLMLGHSGFASAYVRDEVEEFCDNVATAWLLPERTLDELVIEPETPLDKLQQRIGQFARERNLSRTMVAYRLRRAERLDRGAFERLQQDFRRQWRQSRESHRVRARASAGGPSWYVVRRHRVGRGLRVFTRRMLESGALSTTRAARILGVKPAQVGKLLDPGSRGVSSALPA